MRIENLTTLIYITRGDKCLFIRKTRKGDMNLDKYLGIGGHFESDETAEECVLRELGEESSIDKESLEDFRYRGIITFISNEYPTEYMHVFSASVPESFELPESGCDEGELCWVPLTEKPVLLKIILSNPSFYLHLSFTMIVPYTVGRLIVLSAFNTSICALSKDPSRKIAISMDTTPPLALTRST